MKLKTSIIMAAAMACLSVGANAATTIFQDGFTTPGIDKGGSYTSSIVGTAPTVGSGTWQGTGANGEDVGGWGQTGDGKATPTTSNFLAFTPNASLTYTVQATIDTTGASGLGSSWFTLGFTSSRHNWNGADSGTIDTANLVRFDDATTKTITYTLSGATLVANSISHVGWITDLPGVVNLTPSNEQVKITNFSLTAVPEPSAALLGALGLLALLRRRR